MAGIKQKPAGWLKEFLDEKVDTYNRVSFIEDDPVSIPHRFSKKEDIEISALLSATISWGNRKAIIKGASQMMERMDNDPYAFITQATKREFELLKPFVYRTFNHTDFVSFLIALKDLYKKHGGLENVFLTRTDGFEAIVNFRKKFLSEKIALRSLKHISDPTRKSSCKRLHMFLRWMVRKDKRGVDFGLWKNIKPSQLIIPLDVHTGNTSRTLGLLKRTQNDRQAAEELTRKLRSFDPKDPVKYDFALFGMGVNKTNSPLVIV